MKSIIFVGLIMLNAQCSLAHGSKQAIAVSVTDKGFEPSEIKVKPGSHVTLNVTRKTESTCATNIVIKEKKIKKELPMNQEVAVDVGVVKKGKITFACGMDMISGHVVAE